MASQNRSLENAIYRLVDNLSSQNKPSGLHDLLTGGDRSGDHNQPANEPEPPVPMLDDDDRRLFDENNDQDTDSDPADAGPSGLQLKDELRQLHLLTQYLEPSSTTAQTSTQFINMTPTFRKGYELAKMKQNYLEKTDKIDKMSGHRDSLIRAVYRGIASHPSSK